MIKPMHKRYAGAKPIGAASINGVFVVHFYEPDEIDRYKDNCDYICSYSNGSREWGYHKHKVYYPPSGRAYICKGSLRIYLDEVLRV